MEVDAAQVGCLEGRRYTLTGGLETESQFATREACPLRRPLRRAIIFNDVDLRETLEFFDNQYR